MAFQKRQVEEILFCVIGDWKFRLWVYDISAPRRGSNTLPSNNHIKNGLLCFVCHFYMLTFLKYLPRIPLTLCALSTFEVLSEDPGFQVCSDQFLALLLLSVCCFHCCLSDALLFNSHNRPISGLHSSVLQSVYVYVKLFNCIIYSAYLPLVVSCSCCTASFGAGKVMSSLISLQGPFLVEILRNQQLFRVTHLNWMKITRSAIVYVCVCITLFCFDFVGWNSCRIGCSVNDKRNYL